ncbi:hypothetical protein EVJ58_g2085 [Rhodofomes roseus]|uniref:Uncharacterized protein n=1 Tax=Rhodofomes roseus TaxID=34475 RepID=A0A4Y9YS84_9APHY|nr:hypothetical protein EVJ58_g2085 [Rhodofomes roseus]
MTSAAVKKIGLTPSTRFGCWSLSFYANIRHDSRVRRLSSARCQIHFSATETQKTARALLTSPPSTVAMLAMELRRGSQLPSAAVTIAMLSASYYFNVLIIIDVILVMIYENDYGRVNLIRNWDALLVGTLTIHDIAISTYVSYPTQGIGGSSCTASITALETTNDRKDGRNRAFILKTNVVSSAGAPTATIVFLIVLSAAQPGHLRTVWPVCIGIGIVLPLAAICYNTLGVMSRRLASRFVSVCIGIPATLDNNGPCMLPVVWFLTRCSFSDSLVSSRRFIYGFVAFPKIVFSALILYTFVDGDLWRTAGFELLLGVFALGGSVVGAIFCHSYGRRNTILLSFIGYDVFALIIGCAYKRLLSIVPLLVVFYALMLLMGNVGPGNLMSLIASEGSFYGITAAFGTAGAIAGIHAFNAIDENLRKQWGFVITAICGIVGVVVAYFLPSAPAVMYTNPSEEEATREVDTAATCRVRSQHEGQATQGDNGGTGDAARDRGSVVSYVDKDAEFAADDDFVPFADGMSHSLGPDRPDPFGMPGAFDMPHLFHERDSASAPATVPCPSLETRRGVSSDARARVIQTNRVLLLQRMSADEALIFVPTQSSVVAEVAPTARQVQEVISECIISSDLEANFSDNQVFLEAVTERAANLLPDDPHTFPITEENVRQITWLSMYQPIIYCDDSSSMAGERWRLQRDLVNRIASIVTQVVPENYGVWLRFINSRSAWDNLTLSRVLDAVDTVNPDGATPLGTTLRNRILQPLVTMWRRKPD